MNLGKIYILGDSYSTYEGCVPQGYDCYYANEIKQDTDVCRQSETWWQQLLNKTGAELLENNSYSGTTIGNTGYNGAYCPKTSFIGRFSAELQSGAFSAKQPNTVLIFGGTNDFWAGAPLGKLQFENWTDEDLKCTLPAFCCLLHTVKQAFLKAKIVVIINDLFSPELTLGLKQGCEAYQVPFVALRSIEKQGGHPNKVGMTQIFEQLYHRLENC